MRNYGPNQKTLSAAILMSLLVVCPAWAANQTTTETVTASNTAATRYSSIDVTQDAAGGYETSAIAHYTSDAMTVYMADGGTISVSSAGTTDTAANVFGINNYGTMPLTVDGALNLTATADSSAAAYTDATAVGTQNVGTLVLGAAGGTNSVKVNAVGGTYAGTGTGYIDTEAVGLGQMTYGSETATTTVSGTTNLEVSAVGGQVASGATVSAADANATGIGYHMAAFTGFLNFGTGEFKLDAVTGSIKAIGGTVNSQNGNANANASGVDLKGSGKLTAAGLDLTVLAKGGTAAGANETVNAEAYGISQYVEHTSAASTNTGNVTVTGDTKLNVSAVGGTYTGDGTASNANAEANGIYNWTGTKGNSGSFISPASAKMNLGAVSGSVTAIGGTVNVVSSTTTKTASDASAVAHGIENDGIMTLDSANLTVTASGGTVAAGTGSVRAEAIGLKQYMASGNDADSNMTITGDSNVNVTATAGNYTDTGEINYNDAFAMGVAVYEGINSSSASSTILDFGKLTAMVTATGGNVNTQKFTTVADAYGMGIEGIVNTADLDLTVTATGGNASGTTEGVANEGIGYTMAHGIANGGTTSLQISGDTKLNVKATAGSAVDGAVFNYNDVGAYGIALYGATADMQNLTAAVSASGGDYTEAYGVYTADESNVTAKAVNLDVTAAGGYGANYNKTEAYGIRSRNYTSGTAATTFTGPTIFNIKAASGTTDEDGTLYTLAEAAFAQGTNNTVNLQDVSGTVQAASSQQNVKRNETYADGLFASSAAITAANVDLNISAQSQAIGSKYNEVGVYGLGAGYDGTIQINGDTVLKTSVTPSGAANEYYFADALYANNDGVVNVGTDGTDSLGKTVQMEGDVLAANGGTINLTLDGQNSYLQGNVATVSPWTYNSKAGSAGTVNMTVTNGAVWKPVYDNRYGSFNTADYVYDSAAKGNVYTYNTQAQDYTTTANSIDALTLKDGGIVDLTWDNPTRSSEFRTLSVGNLSGDDGVFKINADLRNNKADNISIGEGSTSTRAYIDVAYDPVLASETLTAGKTITGKANVVSASPTSMTFIGKLDSYNLYSYTPDLVNNGDGTWDLTGITIDTAKTSGHVTSAAQDRIALNSLWYDEANNLTKRMGDLRGTTPADTGIWVRYNHSKLEQSDTKIMANLFQVGFDNSAAAKNGTIYRGLAVSHARGNSDYDLGSGDLKETTLSLYQTGIRNDGRYYDIIAKIGRYNGEYDLTQTANPSSADYSTWAYSIGGEFGKRYELGHGLYTEPQAEFILGRIDGTDYTTSRGMHVALDAQNRAITRLGVAFGKKFTSGSLYGRVSYYHDFGSGINLLATDDGNSLTYGRDLAKNWGELTLGGTVTAGKDTQIYGELTKYVGQLTSNIQFNVGARWKI